MWGLFILNLQDKTGRGSLFLSSFLSRREGKEERNTGNSVRSFCRLSMNNPPTAVGGISDFSHGLSKPMVSVNFAGLLLPIPTPARQRRAPELCNDKMIARRTPAFNPTNWKS